MIFGVLMSIPTQAQAMVRAVVTVDFANVRIIPAIGADVRGSVPAGFVVDANARSSDNEWLRFDYLGEEGWIGVPILSVLEGNIANLPVADPRSIPYGGFESPRAGNTTATSAITARLTSGLRLRAGPSTAYPELTSVPYNTIVPVHGRTAGNGWMQISYQGTLGWVTAQWLGFTTAITLDQLPIDGIVAESLPLSQATANDYIALLRHMRSRVDLAQPSLDTIRALWADSSLTGRATCPEYPPQPSDLPIATPLLAAYYTRLEPLQTLFNDAMFNVRRAIDLYIEVCNQPGLQNLVGQGTVIGALDTIALADRQFAELRLRIDELIPADLQAGDGQCLFTYNGESQVLPVITVGQRIDDYFNARDRRYATGYCFDAIEGQVLIVETAQQKDSNIVHQVSVSPFDNPTNFLALSRGQSGNRLLRVGPIRINQTGRYLLVLSNDGFPAEGYLLGNFVMLLSNATTAGTGGLAIDPVTGDVVVQVIIPSSSTPISPVATTAPAVCPSLSFGCEQLASCDQAKACLSAGNFSLDPDSDGVPCEDIRCPAFP
jgi:hypothetical protein